MARRSTSSAEEARRERSARWSRVHRGADLARARASLRKALLRIQVAERRRRPRGIPGRTVADPRPFHWEYAPPPVAADPAHRGRRPAPRHGAGQRLQERRAEAPGRDPHGSAAASPTCRRSRMSGHGGDPPGPGVVVITPSLTSTRSPPATWTGSSCPRGGAKMRASFILLGPSRAVRQVIISNRRGPHRRRPVNLHVDAMRRWARRSSTATGILREGPGRLRGGDVRFPNVTVMARRTRSSPHARVGTP